MASKPSTTQVKYKYSAESNITELKKLVIEAEKLIAKISKFELKVKISTQKKP